MVFWSLADWKAISPQKDDSQNTRFQWVPSLGEWPFVSNFAPKLMPSLDVLRTRVICFLRRFFNELAASLTNVSKQLLNMGSTVFTKVVQILVSNVRIGAQLVLNGQIPAFVIRAILLAMLLIWIS
uniref:ABC transmembrane type-1 domain-containing protein n=1 Tax=Mesocestoides corti TaxID=53468 RepID=A0A5K3G1I0_MESCO